MRHHILRIAGGPQHSGPLQDRVVTMAIGDATKLSSVSDKRSVKQTIPITHRDEPSLPQLRVFDVLLREHSLTHAARELGIPAAAREPVLPGVSGHPWFPFRWGRIA